MQARRPALEPADHDQVRQRALALGLTPAPLELAPLGREALLRPRDHRLVGGIVRLAARALASSRCGPRQPPAPSFFAASRKLRDLRVGFLRPSSFSPCRLTQITGTFIFSSGSTSAS